MSELRVDVDYDYQSVPRRPEIDVHLPDSPSAARLARLKRVADTCTTRRALGAGFEFDGRIVTEPDIWHRQAA